MEFRIEKDTMGEVQVPAENTGRRKPNVHAITSKSGRKPQCHTKSLKPLVI